MGGMNETGLVVEVMWLQGTKYPARDERPALRELSWVQYQLDNCCTIGEVIATDSKIRITGDSAPIHYLVCDTSGNAAVLFAGYTNMFSGMSSCTTGDNRKSISIPACSE